MDAVPRCTASLSLRYSTTCDCYCQCSVPTTAIPLVPTSSVLPGCKHPFIMTFPMTLSLILYVADDSDEGSYDLDNSDEDYEDEQEINFTDLAALAMPSLLAAPHGAVDALALCTSWGCSCPHSPQDRKASGSNAGEREC